VDRKGDCVFAADSFAAGEIIGYYEGHETAVDTMHSIHADGTRIEGTGILAKLAHSCAPNARFRDGTRWLHALADIAPGDELTIDYLDTEPVISHPFVCRCGAPACRGRIG
jgi:hypothetical protein